MAIAPTAIERGVNNYTADVGDEVSENQVVVLLKPADYLLALNEARANLEAARARLAAAEKTFNRFKSLLPREVIAQEAYDKAEADYKSSKAAVSQMDGVVSVLGVTLHRIQHDVVGDD